MENKDRIIRRCIYACCFLLLCIIDQRTKTCSGLDGWSETFRNLTGIVMAVLILSHYRLRDIKERRIPCLVWAALGLVGGVVVIFWGRTNAIFWNAWIVAVLDVVIFGFVLILTLGKVVGEHQIPGFHRGYVITVVVMMVLMIFSRSEYLWPLTYLIMFGCFLLTSYTDREREDLLQGMLDGLIFSFFVFQGYCFVFRPYDVVRYKGIYANPNINALFYLVVLAAVLAKLLFAVKNNAKWYWKLYYWLGIGVLLSFLFMTIGRTAWITAAVLMAVGLWQLGRLQKKTRCRFVKNCAIALLSAVLTFPLCFAAVRYLPPVFHHVVWFWGEYSEDSVHSWDPWNSEKYVDLDEFLDAAVGRILDSIADVLQHSAVSSSAKEAELVWTDGMVLLADVTDTEDVSGTEEASGVEENAEEISDTEESSDTEEVVDSHYENAVLKDSNAEQDGILTRSVIYWQFFSKLNLRGHPESEQGFQLTPSRWIGHAHNIYLQYGTDFGVPVMLLFIFVVIWSIVLLAKNVRGDRPEAISYLLLFLVPTVFGLLEYSWGTGSVTIFLLFIAMCRAAYIGEKS